MGKIARFVLLSCVVLVPFAVLYGCGQANSPVEKQEKKHGVEQAAPKPVTEIRPVTEPVAEPMSEPPHTPASTSSSEGMPSREQAAQSEANCRLANYVSNENMTQQQASALSKRVANRRGKKMQDDPSLSAGRAENAALDDLAVPRYPECKVGGE